MSLNYDRNVAVKTAAHNLLYAFCNLIVYTLLPSKKPFIIIVKNVPLQLVVHVCFFAMKSLYKNNFYIFSNISRWIFQHLVDWSKLGFAIKLNYAYISQSSIYGIALYLLPLTIKTTELWFKKAFEYQLRHYSKI